MIVNDTQPPSALCMLIRLQSYDAYPKKCSYCSVIKLCKISTVWATEMHSTCTFTDFYFDLESVFAWCLFFFFRVNLLPDIPVMYMWDTFKIVSLIEILFALSHAREWPFKSSEISATSMEDFAYLACFSLQWLTVPFNNMQTLKFKPQPKIVFFTTINQILSRSSSQLPTTAGCDWSNQIAKFSSDNENSDRQQSEAGKSCRTFDWLTAVKNAFVGWTLNLRVCKFAKGAISQPKTVSCKIKHYLVFCGLTWNKAKRSILYWPCLHIFLNKMNSWLQTWL